MGIILGYLAQRSRICFIGGLRDFILVRDTELLKGTIAFFVTAWLAFSVVGWWGWLDWQTPEYQGSQPTSVLAEPQAAAEAKVAGRAAPLPVRSFQAVSSVSGSLLLLTVLAGVIIGLFSTLANGCPTRQHVLAAQGMRDSMFYLAGFYLGVIFYYLITRPLLAYFI
jgi:uncharacterized membrane protein YedE/YeeE